MHILFFLTALFHSLDPLSVQQNLAYYELYPESEEGKRALTQAATLIKAEPDVLASLAHAVNSFSSSTQLEEEQINCIEQLSLNLCNRKLKGYHVQSEEELLALAPEEFDIAIAVVLSQTHDLRKAKNYSALLDIMALQIKTRCPAGSPRELIEAMNQFVFETMRFRFPPQSVYAKNIDRYTFLAQVMDDHLGVCLGVSTMVLALGQRLGLPLEAITPPGHIYVRYCDEKGHVVIETTMRGVDVPEEQYLSIHTHHLAPRTLKEVVGMAHVNEASCHLHKGEWDKAKVAYEKALLYMKEDPMVLELLGFCKLFVGEEEGYLLLEKAIRTSLKHTTLRHKLAEDFLAGKVDLSGIAAVVMEVDETKESLEKKRDALVTVVTKYPQFREGLSQLAVTWLMLNRSKEAMKVLGDLEKIEKDDPLTYYYLTLLHGQRRDYKSAWQNFLQAEALLKECQFMPKALKELRYELTLCSPERNY